MNSYDRLQMHIKANRLADAFGVKDEYRFCAVQPESEVIMCCDCFKTLYRSAVYNAKNYPEEKCGTFIYDTRLGRAELLAHVYISEPIYESDRERVAVYSTTSDKPMVFVHTFKA